MPVVAAEAFAKGLLDFIQARKAIPQEQGSATLAIRLLSCQLSSFCLNLRPSSRFTFVPAVRILNAWPKPMSPTISKTGAPFGDDRREYRQSGLVSAGSLRTLGPTSAPRRLLQRNCPASTSVQRTACWDEAHMNATVRPRSFPEY